LFRPVVVKLRQKLTAAVIQQLPPSDNPGMPETIEPSAANPPGARLVTHKRTVQVPQLHNDLTLLNERWTVEHLLPQLLPGTH